MILEQEEAVHADEMGDPILSSEFDRVLRHLYRNKAPGIHEIPSELQTTSGVTSMAWLFDLACKMYDTGGVSFDLRQNVVTPIPKKAGADNLVYCQGAILHTMQMANVYKDSKTFVDMRMKYSEKETFANFEHLTKINDNILNLEHVKIFLNEHFVDGNELEETDPLDWTDTPAVLSRISDPKLREWAGELNKLWKNHTRKVSKEVTKNPDRYSLIYVPNRFVVPGGRFREFYYWDTYWIIRGLLLCEMKDTVRGMLENFIHMVRIYGHIPNGGRIYYIQRSQPPLFIPMVDAYYQETADLEFVRQYLDVLEHEYSFWKQKRSVEVHKNGRSYMLARYYANSKGPRPESYREDYNIAREWYHSNPERTQEFYVDIKSGAESGWDFSSRWYISEDGTNKGKLKDIHTREIIPVDLNSFLCMNAQIMAKLCGDLGYFSKAGYYAEEAEYKKKAMTDVFWDEEEGSWFDYDIRNFVARKYFYPSNLTPLWTGCYDYYDVVPIAKKVIKYLNKHNMSSYYGIPTSESFTKEQWDFPNAWPPLQAIVIQGLVQTQQPAATQLAYEYADRWVQSNYMGFQQESRMYEKYNATEAGASGRLGEYDVQSGFGWTNGVIIELLSMYGDKMRVDKISSKVPN
ncbi:trehalase-like [Anabrus simplex]|uniref:trehalase-like n=1 Tax=Anabrus simplex TaxID=316456 RepID=UPI0035A3649C